jgi:Co/Zn/Cd efflux system component
MDVNTQDPRLRRTIREVALWNLGYFWVEFAVALSIGSVALLADSIDFLEDASTNGLILLSLAWSALQRARVGKVLAGFLLIPTLATVWAVWQKFSHPVPPEAMQLSLTGLGALVVNVYCAWRLATYRHEKSSLTRAAFLCARNDALANIAIIGAGLLTAWHPSIWPDVVIGLGIAFLNGKAAWEVWELAKAETAELLREQGEA